MSDLTNNDNFNYVEDELLDVKNVADYFIAETFYCNIDWIGPTSSNNVKIWRPNNPEGRFRYILWDTDLGTGLIDPNAMLYYNLLGDILSPGYISVHALLIQNLLTNVDYATYFLNRYADLLNTSFHPDRTVELAYDLADDMRPEMARHFGKWGAPPINILGYQIAKSSNVAEWDIQVDSLALWMDQRPQIVRDHIQGMIGSPTQYDLTLNVKPAGAGYIKLNTIVPDLL